MKKYFALLLCVLLLTGCGNNTVTKITAEPTPPMHSEAAPTKPASASSFTVPEYISRFDAVTDILLSDEGITVDGGSETDAVYTSRDIIYYEDRDTYDSGNPYGEGTDADKHTAQEAAAHTVVNITRPGAYRFTGKLSAGQLRVDLGEDAYGDPDAVVELILNNADIACTVAPAILFLNTYEFDGNWSADTARPDVDTAFAGASLILEGENTVSGSHVAKIFKDKDGEKKLWKQDGAIYSYMSLNVYGPGSLDLTADNEGLDTELHLTINGGDITIRSDNDGINTNEDGVSVTAINGGNVTIFAGLGAEGDGIDSNGYLVINGGTVISSANPSADAGLDSDLGSFINGGTVIAFGSTMDWAESESAQVTMNLQFASSQDPGMLVVAKEDGTVVFALDPASEYGFDRSFTGIILSFPDLRQGTSYTLTLNDTQLSYTGTDIQGGMGRHPGGMGNFQPGQMPENFDPSQFEGRGPFPEGMGDRIPPEGFEGAMPEGMVPPELPEGETFPAGRLPEMPQAGFDGRDPSPAGESSTSFHMHDMVNAFSGVAPA